MRRVLGLHDALHPMYGQGLRRMPTKEECDREAKENWQLAQQADRAGDKRMADEARQRAIEWEKNRDSWLYRTFGW